MNALTFKRVGFAVVVLASCVADDALSQQYTVTDLGTLPGGYGSAALGINNLGQVVGSAITNLGDQDVFLYSGGSMQDLGTFGTSLEVTAINDSGQIVGSVVPPNSSIPLPYAFLYSGGSTQYIVTGGEACAINNLGQIVGCTQRYGNGSAFLYSGGSTQNLGTLPTPYDFSSGANGINNSGQVVGASYHSSSYGPSHAFLFNGGSMQDIGTLPAPYNYSSCAVGINNLGQVVGYSSGYSSGEHVFLYGGGSMYDLGAGSPIGINNHGQIVGYFDSGIFLYSGGAMQDLNSLIVPGSGWTFGSVTGINDSGQICGSGTNSSGQTDALLLTPTSNPKPYTVSWKGGNDDTSTSWGVANNWSTGYVPDGPGVNVQFGTQPANCPIVDMVNVGRTVGDITFVATTSTTIRSTYGFALTLDNNGSPSTIDVAGSHTISAQVIINNDTTISGSGTLDLSGGISSAHTLTVLGNVISTSIQVDTLTIGGAGVTAVPEPSTLALFGAGIFGLLARAWRRKRAA